MAVYLNDLVKEGASLSAVTSAFCGIRWGHINTGYLSPTDHPFVKLAFEGAKRVTEVKSNQKEPLPSECIRKLINKFGFENNIMHLRFIIICVLGFAGFFRISELLQLKIKDIHVYDNYADIYVEKSKTDQHREGHIVKISRTGSATCPLYWLKKFLAITSLNKFPESYLLCKTNKNKTRTQGKPVRVNKLFYSKTNFFGSFKRNIR